MSKSANAFRTISEVSEELGVQQHVLRFWETKFTQIRPLKRSGGRRYYRPEDISLLKHIHNLLYTEGYTIKGVQKLLKGQTKNMVLQEQENTLSRASEKAQSAQVSAMQISGKELDQEQQKVLQNLLADLKEIRSIIKDKAA